MVALLESLLSESVPAFVAIQSLSGLESDFKVAALDSEVEARGLVLDEVKGDLGIALL